MSEHIQKTIGMALTGILRYKLTEGWVTLAMLYQQLKEKKTVTELDLDDTKFVEVVIDEIHNKKSVRFIEDQYVLNRDSPVFASYTVSASLRWSPT